MGLISYPSWLYHPEKAACIVADEAAHKALGEGWVDSPAKCVPAPKAEPEAEKKPAKKVK